MAGSVDLILSVSNSRRSMHGLIGSQGKLGCEFCSSANSLGSSKKENLHISEEWSRSLIEAAGKDRSSKLSNLRNKIKKHVESQSHTIAERICIDSEKYLLKECLDNVTISPEQPTT
ncbi:hypothetical protein JTE90_016380 [Oedothorax gibbosus]|uniref:Uncharacterized protein n=1 Tax=Oedothorax gibbosus TaxID=931172 RepID=A0AAV6U8G0_9ARAC|nr:hypothetical protein JTE90_016380 [Oedothorax gibbosus]